MKKLAMIQALRFIAASMVMGAHLIPGFDHIGARGVDVFFVISGFVMVYSSEALFRQPRAARQFLWKRVTRIVPLYWLMTLIVAHTAGNFSWQHIVSSMLFIPSTWPDSAYPALPVLTVGWTLNIEVFFYAIFAAWIALSRELAVAGVACTLIAAVMLGGDLGLPAIAASYWTSPKLLEFVAGCLIAVAYRRGVRLPLDLPRGLTPLANMLGDSSYALYLTHAYVIYMVASGSKSLGAAAAIAASICIYLLVERPMTALLRWRPRAIVAATT